MLLMLIKSENGKEYRATSDIDPFYILFLKNLVLRPSCYECKFKSSHRASDITIADFWGVQKICPEFGEEGNVSLVLLNNEKGKELFSYIKDKANIIEVQTEKALSYNISYEKSMSQPDIRDEVFDLLKHQDFSTVIKKYAHPSISVKIARFLTFIHLDRPIRHILYFFRRMKNKIA